MKQVKITLLALLVMILAGCMTSATNISSNQITLPKSAGYGVIPFENNTDRPQAGNRAAAITAGILQTRGPNKVFVYQQAVSKNNLIAEPNKNISTRSLAAWAKRNNIRYIISGTVNEWRYKVGLDGEPSVNVTIKLYDARNRKYLWNAVGSLTGGSRYGLGVIAQRLIANLLSYINLV
jgi:polysaccharide biosynthesis protein PelC